MGTYINLIEHIANSNSQEEFFDKVMKDVVRLTPKMDSPTKSRKLLKEIVLAGELRGILNYTSHIKQEKQSKL